MLIKNKIAALLVAGSLSLLSTVANAQNQTAKNQTTVQLGKIDATMAKHTNAEAILANPKLQVSKAGFFVSEYTISFMANQKDASGKNFEAFYGPFNVKGAELPEEIKGYLKKYEHNKNKLYIENIQVMGQGMVEKGQPIELICEAK